MRTPIETILAVVVGVAWGFAMPLKLSAQTPRPADENAKHYIWLTERLQEAESIKPGMTEADLLKVFTPDGGLQHFQPQRFVLRSCTLIKVDVMFDLPEGTYSTNLHGNELKIKSVSKPYLEPMYMD